MTQPTLLIKDFTVTEGQEAQFIIGVTSVITGPNKLKLTVNNGSANAADYSNLQFSTDGINFQPFVNGSEVSIAEGKDCIYVKALTVDDNLVEHDRFTDTENFTITATPILGIGGGTVVETGTIIDNDIQRISVVANGDKTEGDYASWTVSVDKETTGRWGWAKYELVDGSTQRAVDYDPNTLEFSTNGGQSWSKLFEGSDFGYAFKPGENSIQVRVKTNTDSLTESTEGLVLKVTPNTQGLEHLAPDVVQATVNIKDAPAAVQPSLLIKDFTVTEGQEGQFIIGATSVLNGPNKLKLTVGDGSASAADYTNLQISTDGINFQPFTNGGEYSIANGKDCLYVKFLAVDDNSVEHDRFADVERFTITATPISGFSGSQVVETAGIIDNDIQRISVVANGDKTEGEYASWTVSVDKETTGRWGWAKYELVDGTTQRTVDYDPNTLEFSTNGGSTWSKLFEGSDFGYAFKPGEKSIQVRVKTTDDALVESTENLILKVTPNTQGLEHLAPDVVQAAVSIKDNDVAAPTAKIAAVVGSEVVEGGKVAFTIQLTNVNGVASNISLSPIDDTALAAQDYTLSGAEVSFNGGQSWAVFDGLNVSLAGGATEFQVRYNTIDDQVVEPTESYKLKVSTNGSSGTGTGVIKDNDKALPKVSLVGTEALKEGGEKGQYCVQLDRASDIDRVFTIRVDNGTAQRYDGNGAGQDFTWGGAFDISSTGKVFYGRVPNDNINGNNNRAAVGPEQGDATWDYSVYNGQGQLNQGNTIRVKVAAGQTKSEQFAVQAWNEKVTVDQDYANPNGLNKNNYKEGQENFSLQITDAQGLEVTKGKLDVLIEDKSQYVFVSPIAIDLDRNGIQTVSVDAGVKFDILNSGTAVNTGWISGGDGFLAVDRNGNGSIDNRSELFGGAVGAGFEQLDSFDSNRDGLVNNQDSHWQQLSIWQDGNSNGITDAGELGSLDAFGIASLTVAHSSTFTPDAQGNILGEQSAAITTNGQSLAAIDVYFQVKS
jgi:Calx-beta domain